MIGSLLILATLAFSDPLLGPVGFRDSLIYDPLTAQWMEVRTFRNTVVETLRYLPLADTSRDVSVLAQSLIQQLQYRRTQRAQNAGGGLIPDIEIPVSVPGFGNLGEGSRLRIEGSQVLTFGGSARYSSSQIATEYGGQSTFPELKLDQQLRVLLSGTVGRKINVLIDHDSQRENRLKNKVRLQYKGDEDEIVQLIEAGDTRLNLPGNPRFASFSSGAQKSGLFGIRSELLLGPVKMTVVATREQGESQSATFRAGGGQVRTDTIWAKDYVRYTFYTLLDTTIRASQLEVFLNDYNSQNDSSLNAQIAVARYFDVATHQFDSTVQDVGMYHRLIPGTDYVYYEQSGVLEFLTPPDPNASVGVVYWNGTDTVGRLTGDTLLLRLVKPSSPRMDSNATHADTVLWLMELKNVYQVGYGDITPGSFQLTIYRDSSGVFLNGERGKTYLQLLGLDPDGDGRLNPTVRINGRDVTVFDENRGYLFFPDPLPFISDSLSVKDSVIYFKKNLQPDEGRIYALEIRYIQSSSQIQLPAFNLLEGSVRVIANGRTLQEGTDYTVDYQSGLIQIRNPELLRDTTAQIEVSYEYSQFFSLRQTSLLGTTLEYSPSDALSLTGTALFRTQSTQELRPRLDEAPMQNLVLDLVVSTSFFPSVLERWLYRWVPRPERFTPSIQIKGEVARSFPNPNTLGVGYLDAMEDSRLSVDLPMSRIAWHFTSIPAERDTTGFARRLIWANPPYLFKKSDIVPDLPPQEARDYASVLMLAVTPNIPGDTGNWAGILRNLSQLGEDFTQLDFIEVVVKGDEGTLVLDFGDIDENSIRRNADATLVGLDPVLETEDKNGNGFLDAGEDTGLDGVAGEDGQQVPGDDGNDDYAVDPNNQDYSHINGTENNRVLDTEDLDRDGILDRLNRYFSYRIPLDTLAHPDAPRPYAVYNGWRYYRIPLRDLQFQQVVGDLAPDETQIRYARIRWENFTRSDTLYLYRIQILGNRWRTHPIVRVDSTSVPVDSTERVGVGVVNNRETPGYTSPPGTPLRRNPDGTQEIENATSLVVENLQPGHAAFVFRLPTVDRQAIQTHLQNYRQIHLWIRPAAQQPPPYGTFFIRLGSDSTNYYELRKRLTSSDWVDISAGVEELARLRDSLQRAHPGDSVFQNGNLVIHGTPNLLNLGYYAFGVLNEESAPLTTELWVNELRLSEPRTDHGTALHAEASINLGGFFNGNLSYDDLSSAFQPFSSRTPSTTSRRGMTMNASGDLMKLFSLNPPLSLSYNYMFSESRNLPRYAPGTDLLITRDFARRYEGVNRSRNISLNAQFQRYLFLKGLSFGLSERANENTDPLRFQKNHNVTRSASAAYGLQIQRRGWTALDIRPWPTHLSVSFSYSEPLTDNLNTQSGVRTFSHKWYYEGNGQIDWNPVRNLRVSYHRSGRFAGYMAPGDSRPPLLNDRETGSFSLTLPVRFFNPSLSMNLSYQENFPEDSSILSLGIRRINRTQNLNGTASLPVDRLLGPLAEWIRKQLPDTSRVVGSPAWLMVQLVGVVRNLDPIAVQASQIRNDALGNADTHPSLKYRFGLTDQYPGTFDPLTSSQGLQRTLTLRTGSRVMGMNISTQATWGRNLSYYGDQGNFRANRTFPSLTLSLPLYQARYTPGRNRSGTRAGNRSSAPFSLRRLSMNLTLEWTREAQGALTDQGPQKETESLRSHLEPQIQGSLANGLNFTFSLSQDETRNARNLRFRPVEGVEFSRNWRLSADYSFSNPEGFKIPLAGGQGFLRFRGTLNLRLNLVWGTSRRTEGGIPYEDTRTYQYSLTGSYTFSRGITADLTFQRQETQYRVGNIGKNGSTDLFFTVRFNF